MKKKNNSEVQDFVEDIVENADETLDTVVDNEANFEKQIDQIIEQSSTEKSLDNLPVEVGVNIMDVEELQTLVDMVKQLREEVSALKDVLNRVSSDQQTTHEAVLQTQRGVIKFADHVAKSLRSEVAQLVDASTPERLAIVESAKRKPMKSTYFPDDAPGG